MPRQKKNSPAKSPSPFRGESPPGVSQDSGADTGAADAAPLLPNPRAEAQNSEAPALSFGSTVQPLLDPPSGAGDFVANDSEAGRPGSLGAKSLLLLLDPSQPSDSDFALWFDQHFDSSPDLSGRLVEMHRLNSSLMRNWIALLTYAWSMSESVRASSQFGLKLLEVLSSSLSAEFVELFLMFLPTDFEVSSHLTPMPPTVRKLRSFDFAIKDAVFNKLRMRCRDKRLPGDWPSLVNEAFFAVLGDRVIALTDLGKLLPLGLLYHLGARRDLLKLLPKKFHSTLSSVAHSSRGDLRSILAHGAISVTDADTMFSRFQSLGPLLFVQSLCKEQVGPLQDLVSLLAPYLTPAVEPTHELGFYAQELDNLCKLVCNFCIKLSEVLVELEVPRASTWASVVNHICLSHLRRSLNVLTCHDVPQVLDPLSQGLLRDHPSILPAFQAISSMLELLGGTLLWARLRRCLKFSVSVLTLPILWSPSFSAFLIVDPQPCFALVLRFILTATTRLCVLVL